jgi:hypothetical protein
MLTIFISSGARPAICSANHSANNFSYPIQGNRGGRKSPRANLSDAELPPSLCRGGWCHQQPRGFIEQKCA